MKYFIFLVCLFITISVSAQYDSNWTVNNGEKGDDIAYSVVETRDGGYAFAGKFSSNNAVANIIVGKYFLNGKLAWDYVFECKNNEIANDITETQDGSLVVVGKTEAGENGGIDMFLMKLEANGDLLWEKTFGTDNRDVGRAVVEASDGSLYIAGQKFENKHSYQGYVVKLTKDGDIIWERNIGGKNHEDFSGICENSRGDIMLVGRTESITNGGVDMLVAKVSARGTVLWQENYGGRDNDLGYAITESAYGEFTIAGATRSKGVDNQEIWLLCIDSYGDKIWEKTYGGAGTDYARDITTKQNGNIIVVGYIESINSDNDIYVLEVDAAGNFVWDDVIGGSSSSEAAYSVIETMNNSLIIAGYQRAMNSQDKQYLLMKLNPENGIFDRVWANRDIPESKLIHKNHYAVIIGVEDYENIPDAEYASSDVEYFEKYANGPLGIPKENILILKNQDATAKNIKDALRKNGWLDQHTKSYDTEAIVFFSGHGIYETSTKTHHLTAHDFDGVNGFINTYSVENLRDDLSALEIRSATVFLDACFSGLDRGNEQLMAGRGIVNSPAFEPIKDKNITIFSSSEGMQYSRIYPEKNHGLFTYYLLMGLGGDAKGNDNTLTVSELSLYIKKKVSKKSNNQQMPTTVTSNDEKIIVTY